MKEKVLKIISVLLVVAAFFTVAACLIVPLFGGSNSPIGGDGAFGEDGGLLEAGKVHDLPRAVAFTASEGPQSMTVRAQITPESTADKRLDWSVSFEDPASEWAQGKDAGDYIAVSPESDGAATATVTCKQAFGEPILLKVSSRANPEVSTQCKIDYLRKVESVKLYFGNVEMNLGGTTNVSIDLNENDQKKHGGAVRYEVNYVDEELPFTLEQNFDSSTVQVLFRIDPKDHIKGETGHQFYGYGYNGGGEQLEHPEGDQNGKEIYFDRSLLETFGFFTFIDRGYFDNWATLETDRLAQEVYPYISNKTLFHVQLKIEGEYIQETLETKVVWNELNIPMESVTVDPDHLQF